MTEHEMATLVTQKLKDLHLEIARQWKIPAEVIAGTSFGLGVAMLFECGHDEREIVGLVRQLVNDLIAAPDERGAS